MSRRGRHRAMRYRAYVRYGNRDGRSSHRTLKSLALLAVIAIATPLAVFSGNDDASSAHAVGPAAHRQDAPPSSLAGPEPPAIESAGPSIDEADAATITAGAGQEVASNAAESSPAVDRAAVNPPAVTPSATRSASSRPVTLSPPRQRRAARRADVKPATQRHAVGEERAATPTKWEVRVDDNARPGESRPDASLRKSPVPGLEAAAVRRGIG